jgi:hypothetical protein
MMACAPVDGKGGGKFIARFGDILKDGVRVGLQLGGFICESLTTPIS